MNTIFQILGSVSNATTASLLGLSPGGLVYGLWAGILGYLPHGIVWPQAVHDGAQFLFGAMSKLNFILPVATLIQVMVMLLTIRVSLAAWFVVKNAANWIRGVSTFNRL